MKTITNNNSRMKHPVLRVKYGEERTTVRPIDTTESFEPLENPIQKQIANIFKKAEKEFIKELSDFIALSINLEHNLQGTKQVQAQNVDRYIWEFVQIKSKGSQTAETEEKDGDQ